MHSTSFVNGCLIVGNETLRQLPVYLCWYETMRIAHTLALIYPDLVSVTYPLSLGRLLDNIR